MAAGPNWGGTSLQLDCSGLEALVRRLEGVFHEPQEMTASLDRHVWPHPPLGGGRSHVDMFIHD